MRKKIFKKNKYIYLKYKKNVVIWRQINKQKKMKRNETGKN